MSEADGALAREPSTPADIQTPDPFGMDGLLRRVLDDVRLSPLERLRLTRELAKVRAELQTATTMQRLGLARRLAEVRAALGAVVANQTPVEPEPAAPAVDPVVEIAQGRAERRMTSQFYDYDPNRKPAQRRRENAEAMEILRKVEAGEVNPNDLTDADRQALVKYSGTGGNLVGADGKKGSAYEYYTPKPIAEGMWNLLRELGFQGGRTLDPSSGVGIFGGTAPPNAAIDSVELNATSGRVNQLVNEGPGYSTTIAPFEQVAAATPDETYDAVITNVPFGGVADRGGNQFKDTKYRGEPLQNYFILRSLEKLKPGGLAAFITPPRCVSGKGGKEEDLRVRVSYMAEFLGAYRLPNSVFGTAAADTMTDVIVFRKYSRKVQDKIAELREQNSELPVKANVLWPEFINGTYFLGEGLRFVLGTMGRAKGQFGEKDVLNSDLSMTDIAKLLRKFPGSRVDWAALDAAETAPIVYREGDTVRHAGQTLQMQNGRLVMIKPAGAEEAAAELAEAVARLTTPLGAVNSGATYAEGVRVQQGMLESGQALVVPDWLRGLLSQLLKLPDGARESAWGAATVGLAVDQAMEERMSEESGFNYLEGYPILSEAMKRVVSDAKSPPTMLSSQVKTAMKKVVVNYSKADGFSGVWRGDVLQAVDQRDDAQKFEAARYQAGGTAFVPMDEARRVFGEDFDPMEDDGWCLSPDGRSVAKADDYYVGNYADFLARIELDMAAATDNAVRDKLLRQKMMAERRLSRTDPATMSFSLFSPFVTVEERAAFMRQFVDPRFVLTLDEKTGKPKFDVALVGGPKNVRDKLLKRFAQYLNGTRLTLGGADVGDEKAAIAALRSTTTTAEAQFNAWVHANPVIMSRLDEVANDPKRLYFIQVEDESPLTIPGLHPDWKVHGYQASFVRKTGRDFSGVNGDGVGLGKTSQSLIAVQHAQSIGAKRKTMFVVPNSVLSNWRKEAGRVLASTDDCLYVGLAADKKGNLKTTPGRYDIDLNRVLENRHAKIFVTYEAFQRLRLRATTAEQYDAYLASVDLSYANSDSKKDDEKTKSLRAQLIEQLTSDNSKSAAAPFFEDLGIDSLVIDEAHSYKNSRATVDFSSAKFLSLAKPAARGLDAQAKAWFVRKTNPRGDGVLLLTATPVTNSPLEVYSMLSLAVGDAKINDMMMGAKGSDHFMEMMCAKENQDEETLDGLVKPYDVFTGLNNVGVLRNALSLTTTARTAEQVGAQIVVPEAEQSATPVTLPKAVTDMLIEYKEAFRFAIDTVSEKANPRGSEAAYNRVAAKFGEPMELIAHPFNLIQKMTLLIADPELDDRATIYLVSPAQAEKAAALVAAWNAKAPTEDRPRMSPHTIETAVVGKKKKKAGDDDEEIVLLQIKVLAKVDGNRIVLDSMQSSAQADFEAMADKMDVDLDVTVPPKLAALIENFQHEEANPRGRVAGLQSGRVRQLIFCDALAMHAKIKRLLHKRCGVAPSSIAIITGQVNGKPEEIMAVQDGFNAEGEDNKYRVIIANEKAEVGINLQKGTQAIHHLTLGWTPDSLTQRNGRGVRQGNETQRVRVYQYDADGTFDTYKRMLVGKKAGWIDALMDKNGGNKVEVSGGMSREQMEALIDAVGDVDAMGRAQARADASERLAREASTKGKQAIQLLTIKSQRTFLARYPDARSWAADKVAAYVELGIQIAGIQERIDNPKATASAVLRNQNLLAELTAKRDALKRLLDESTKITEPGYRSSYSSGSAPDRVASIDEYIKDAKRYESNPKKWAATVANTMTKGHGWKVEVSEDSGIGNEWQSEVDMANAMITESQRDFASLAAETGGASTELLAKADQDEAAVIDGKMVCTGAFIERAGVLGVVRKSTTGLVVLYITSDGKTRSPVAAADELRKAAVVLPGTQGYDAMLTAAAAIEDAVADTGALSSQAADLLFSAIVPEVARRRSKPMLVRYLGTGYGAYRLPSPLFPVIVRSDINPEGTRVAPLLVAAQAAVVKSTEMVGNSVYFVCDSSVNVVALESSVSGVSMPWDAVRDFARSRGVKITAADVSVMEPTGGRHLIAGIALDSNARKTFLAAIPEPAVNPEGAAKTEAELKQRVEKWVATEAMPDFDVSTDDRLTGDPETVLGLLSPALREVYLSRVRVIRMAEVKAAAAALAAMHALNGGGTPVVPPDTAQVDDEDADTDPNRIVGLTGKTREWKDQIKAAAVSVGGKPIWDGTGGPVVSGKPAGCWNVPFKAWAHLIERSPSAAQDLQVVESSGKMGYGRRGRR